MRVRHWGILALLICVVVLSLRGDLRAATITGDTGDPVYLTGPAELDVQVLKQNGVVVGTSTPVIGVVRANQALGAASVIQHAALNDRIEIVQISSTGGALTSTANPRILAGVQGQIIVLQGTSDTATFTIPDGNGIRLTTSGSALFNTRSKMFLRYDTALSLWHELTPLTGAPTAMKLPVRVASTSNITLSGTPQTIDGVSVSTGDRVLAKDQTTASQNGPYTVGTTWVRAVDFDESAEAQRNAEFVVEEGTTQAGSTCRMTTLGAITLGTTALTFSCNSSPFLNLTQQASDPSPPPAGTWIVYVKSTGLFIRDSAGNITGPLGTGGGGGTVTTEKLPVQAATTGDVTLSNPGTAVFDGVTLSSGQRLLVRQQSTGSQNGIYLFATSSTALTRATDADTSAEFIDSFSVKVQAGTLYGGVTFYFSNLVGAFTLGTTTPTFAIQSWGVKSEVVANKSTVAASVPSGYIGADTNGRVAYNRLGSYAVNSPNPMAAGNSVTPTALMMGIEGSGGPVNLTSNPQIVDGIDGQLLILHGTHATNTVQIDDISVQASGGVRLCGNKGSTIIGLSGDDLILKFNVGLDVWEELGCGGLQRPFNTGRTIIGASDLASAFQVCDTLNGNCMNFFGSTMQGTAAGAVIDQIRDIATGRSDILRLNGTEAERMTAAGIHTFSNAGKPLSLIAIPSGNLGGSANCTYVQDEAWIASGELQSAWRCTDNDADFLSFTLPMPRTWDRGALIFEHKVHSLTNQNTTVLGEDVALRCIRQGDPDAVYSATGAQTLTATFGNQANDNRSPLTALVTPNGTCTGEAAGTTVMLKGRIRIRQTPTTTTMTNVRLGTLNVFYRAASRSND